MAMTTDPPQQPKPRLFISFLLDATRKAPADLLQGLIRG
jgi:hypothetical protein